MASFCWEGDSHGLSWLEAAVREEELSHPDVHGKGSGVDSASSHLLYWNGQIITHRAL